MPAQAFGLVRQHELARGCEQLNRQLKIHYEHPDEQNSLLPPKPKQDNTMPVCRVCKL